MAAPVVVTTVLANDLHTSARSTAVVQIPASAQTSDVAVFIMSQNTGVATFVAPSGWTARRSVPDVVNNNLQAQVWTRDLVTADIGATVTFSSTLSARLPGVLAIVRGTTAAQMSIALATPVSTAATSHTTAAVTTTVNETALLNLWALRVATAAPAPDLTTSSSQTDDATVKTAFTTAPNYAIHVSHRTTPGAAGAYGGATGTSSAPATSLVYTLLAPPVNQAGGGPTASFVVAPQTGTVPLAVNFSSTSTGSPTSYLWNFGDGTTSTAQNPTHTYVSPGTYTVSLQVSNAAGSSYVVRDAVQATEPAVTSGGLALYVLRSGVLKSLTLYVNAPGEATPVEQDWFREATWNRNAPWGSHATTVNGGSLVETAIATDAFTKNIVGNILPLTESVSAADAMVVVHPKMATLTDTFTSLNTAKWIYAANASVVSNQLQLTTSATYQGIKSVNLFDLTGSHFGAEIVQTATSTISGNRNDTAIGVRLDASNGLFVTKEGGSLYFSADAAGATATIVSIGYDATTHRRWRISESGGTVTWWTSADGISWTSRHTWVSTFPLTACYAIIETGHWGSSGTYTPALIDNVNS